MSPSRSVFVTGTPLTTATASLGTSLSLLPQAVATSTTRATRAATAIRVGFMKGGSLVGVAETNGQCIDEGALIRSCDLLGFVEKLPKWPFSDRRTRRDYSIGKPERPLEIVRAQAHFALRLRVDEGVGDRSQRPQLVRAEGERAHGDTSTAIDQVVSTD